MSFTQACGHYKRKTPNDMTSRVYKTKQRPSGLHTICDRPWRIVVGLVGLFGMIAALFLLLRESSDLRTLGFPDWALLRWMDTHGALRNLPSFALLALPFLLLARGRRQRFKVITWLALFVVATEFCQLALKARFFDLQDILYGWLGLTFSWLSMELFAWHQRVRYRRSEKNAPQQRARHGA